MADPIRLRPSKVIRGVREGDIMDRYPPDVRSAFEATHAAEEAIREAKRHLRLGQYEEAIAEIRRAQRCEERAVRAVGGKP